MPHDFSTISFIVLSIARFIYRFSLYCMANIKHFDDEQKNTYIYNYFASYFLCFLYEGLFPAFRTTRI